MLSGCAATTEAVRHSTITEVHQRACDPLDWPVVAQVSSGFGPRDRHPHMGIDLPVPEGTVVLAACDGVVTYADDKLSGYGRLVIVDHAAGVSTVYAHNRELLVRAGERVARGQAIARSGQTGRASAPHVHFELRIAGKAIDPLPHLVRPLRLVWR